jgi:hypothetical protein
VGDAGLHLVVLKNEAKGKGKAAGGTIGIAWS